MDISREGTYYLKLGLFKPGCTSHCRVWRYLSNHSLGQADRLGGGHPGNWPVCPASRAIGHGICPGAGPEKGSRTFAGIGLPLLRPPDRRTQPRPGGGWKDSGVANAVTLVFGLRGIIFAAEQAPLCSKISDESLLPLGDSSDKLIFS